MKQIGSVCWNKEGLGGVRQGMGREYGPRYTLYTCIFYAPIEILKE